jgi:uncharacterized protein (DUF302 family)
LTAFLVPIAAAAESIAGLNAVKSSEGVQATADKLVDALETKGLTVFSRIDHSQSAEDSGLELRPTQLVVFGNPKLGTTLMKCGQTAGIDLPLKALIWEDANGAVWLGYNTPRYLAERHALNSCEEPLKKIAGALEGFAKAATE